jgi:hypothetical protein
MYGLWSTAFLLIAMAISMIGPAGAQTSLQTKDCTAANIASIAESIDKMKDGKQKATASEEISLASGALAEGKADDCKGHLLKATLQTK